MEYELLLVDGYNLLHQMEEAGEGGRQGAAARDRLVRRIERGGVGMARRIEVVFDGRDRGGVDPAFDTDVLRVVFSPSNRTADGWIEQRVHDAPDPEKILVVTSDGVERRLVTAFGAAAMSCREFIARCDVPSGGGPRVRGPGAGAGRGTLGEFFPDWDCTGR